MKRALSAIGLLILSNSFMTTAWYLHLNTTWSLMAAIGISWLIAFPEYLLQVPANRLGHVKHGGPFSAPQLKIIQEAITIVTFTIFCTFVLKERIKWTDWTAFGLIFIAVAIAAWGNMQSAPSQ